MRWAPPIGPTTGSGCGIPSQQAETGSADGGAWASSLRTRGCRPREPSPPGGRCAPRAVRSSARPRQPSASRAPPRPASAPADSPRAQRDGSSVVWTWHKPAKTSDRMALPWQLSRRDAHHIAQTPLNYSTSDGVHRGFRGGQRTLPVAAANAGPALYGEPLCCCEPCCRRYRVSR